MEDKRKEIYKELHKKYKNLVLRPALKPILKGISPMIMRFPLEIKYESELPQDGVLIMIQNHSNFYDSLVFDKVFKDVDYYCFASDEPRGKITGLSFEAKGVIWLNRGNTKEESIKNREIASQIQLELLQNNQNLSYCPEGTWNTTDEHLMLNIAYGMSKTAIEASKTIKTYIVPLIIEYDYDYKTAKIKKATATVYKGIEVKPTMNYAELTEELETFYWTKRWQNLELKAQNDKENTILAQDNSGYVYPRENINRKQWEEFIRKLKSQYKTDWEKEEKAIIKTKAQIEQEQVEKDMNNPIVILKQPVLKKIKKL